jgi:DNA-directed RNA polymerase specialized sigma54-like protein
VSRQAAEVSRSVSELLRDLSDAGVGARDIDELRALAAELRETEFSANAELLDRETRLTLSLVEQLELALARSTRQDNSGVRANADPEVPEAYRDIVADYYRRLGSAEASD